MLEIPLNNSPAQVFSININGETYEVRVQRNSRDDTWSISFSVSGSDVATGVPLLSGVDIFRQYNLPFKNGYVLNIDNPELDPVADGLGASSKLLILEDSELP